MACRGGVVDPREPTPLPVEYSGCTRVDRGPRCVRSTTDPLNIWIPDVVETIEFFDGDQLLVGSPETIESGQRFSFALPLHSQQLNVRFPDQNQWQNWTLQMQYEPPFERLAKAKQLPPETRNELLSRDQASPAELGRVLGERARAERQKGNTAVAIEYLREALEHHRQHGHDSELQRDANFLAWLQIQEGWLGEARQTLEEAGEPPQGHQDSLYFLSFTKGLLSLRSGDLRSSNAFFADAAEQTRRMGRYDYQRGVTNQLATSLQQSGRYADAMRLWTGPLMVDPNVRSCEAGAALINFAWWIMVVRETDVDLDQFAGPEQRALGLDPIPLLHQAAQIMESDCDPAEAKRRWPGHRVDLALNLALAHLQANDLEEAENHLTQASQLATGTASDTHLALDIEGRIALRRGQGEKALEVYETLTTSARQADAIEYEWKAGFGRAKALELLNRPAEALAAWEQAQDILYQHSFLVPVHLGRADFLALRSEATQRHVALLLRLRRQEEAFELVRRNRARFLAGLQQGQRLQGLSPEERAEWEQRLGEYLRMRKQFVALRAQEWEVPPAELERSRQQQRELAIAAHRVLDRGLSELPASGDRPLRQPGPGELLLAFFEAQEGWLGFGQLEGELNVQQLGAPEGSDPADLTPLLAPFAPQLQAASTITLLPTGDLQEADFHAAPFQGQAPGLSKPVAYSLDLLPTWTSTSQLAQALVVADPRGDLGQARQEGERIAAALQARGLQADLLQGQTATRDALLQALPGRDLLHYAGHGVFSEEVLEGELLLAGESALSVADILALAAPPAQVLLSGCETARSRELQVASLGLAQAFVTAGTQLVAATTRPVADELASAFSAAFYEAQNQDPLQAYRSALAEVAQEQPQADWAAYRLILP